jgi:flagellar hook assembly protein FlgD
MVAQPRPQQESRAVRRLVPALFAGLLALSGVVAPSSLAPTAAAASGPKIVLIVGATHSATDAFRADMDAVYATAIQYSSNVVKIYSPNATWAAVKAALQGANIVVYMGHGNGFPSPYTTALMPDRQDGLGLNAVAGQGDSNTTYYGESYISSSVTLAPNAVVILAHLCYASGDSEPGLAAPSLAVAEARIDNFAAGFLKAGARAVIADAHSDTSWYLDQLFTTHQTIDSLFRSKPSSAGNTFTFASTRSPGFTAYSDPDGAAPYSDFYRSMVALPSLRTDDVTGAGSGSVLPALAPGDTTAPVISSLSVAPAAFSPTVGGADVITATANKPVTWSVSILDSAGQPVSTFASSGPAFSTAWNGRGAAGQPVPDGTYQVVATASDAWGNPPSTARAALALDATPPALTLTNAASGPIVLSPNGDGQNDSLRLSYVLSKPATLVTTVRTAGGATVRSDTSAAPAGPGAVTWDGLNASGALAPDGQYVIDLAAHDAAGNVSPTVSVPVVLATARSAVAAAPAWISPAGSGASPRVSNLSFTLARPASVTWQVTTAAGVPVRTWYSNAPLAAGSYTEPWDGRTDAGALAPAGRYLSQVSVNDGVTSTTEQASVYSGGIRIVVSDSTPAVGQLVTITVVAVEALGSNPSVSIAQPGLARVTYGTTKVGTATYRVQVRLRARRAGRLTIAVAGIDRFGRAASASSAYRLH